MRINIFLLLLAMALFGCGDKHNDAVPEILPPGKPVLLFPAQNSACTPSAISSPSESTILLVWDTVANAESYVVTVKNLISGEQSTQTTNSPPLIKALPRGMPYSWFVEAKSTKTTEVGTSDTWKFYNPGPGTLYYAPFPADAVAPALGQAVTAVGSKINLSWQSADADNDILNYDVYLGTDASANTLVKAKVTDKFLNDNTVTAATTYYWKIVTRDARGNTSESAVFSFKVN
ncbi:hypothetical protein [Mucilaginibacter pedocola]|uniref:Fibronectin type-III domain-containing protein n=1 Tax=Mucilaginibacter pedocola TaxID=1792845 RepID=A0A1S9P8M0_9SPHI|nr:hypothetical protein [Mucilaginibacter pedocola]OOQ57311.1 hypothetical protein BC343_14450 [Mucilaginibacter pedocola]